MNRVFNCLYSFFLALLVLTASAGAVTKTVDADGGADYTSLNTLLSAIQSGSIDPDTILFVGNDQDTYDMSNYVDKASVKIIMIGASQNPDNLTIINHITESYANWLKQTEMHFENLQFTGTTTFNNGQGAGTLSFKKCVIKDFAIPFIKVEGNANTPVIFENCLFEGNGSPTGIIQFNYWGGIPAVSITNCSFDMNKKIFGIQSIYDYSGFNIKNCIFSGNDTIVVSNATLLGKITNSLTSQALTSYGANCVSDTDPKYALATRAKPSDWKISAISPAKGIGIPTSAPAQDISGATRTPVAGKIDAGCWNSIPPDGIPIIKVQPKLNDTLVAGSAFKISVTATGLMPINHKWYKNDTLITGAKDTSVFSIASVIVSDIGSYYCVLTNDSGTVTTTKTKLVVIGKPVITTDLVSPVYKDTGVSVTFSIKASGLLLSYKWKKDTATITGATSESLTFKTTKADSGKTYRCIVTNIAGSCTSNVALLQVGKILPVIKSQPRDTTVPEGGTATFSVRAEGGVTYKWYRNSTKDNVGNDSILTITDANIDDVDKYYCEIENTFGSVTSSTVTLRVNDGKAYNPIKLSASLISKDSVEITIKNFFGLPQDVLGGKAYADTIGIWYQAESYPPVFDRTLPNFIKIPLSALPASGTQSHTVRVEVNNGPDTCFSYYFAASVLWHSPETTPAFVSGNGAEVAMCGSVTITNPLSLKPTYTAGSDSVVMEITGINSLKRDSVDFLLFSYSIGQNLLKDDKIFPSDFPTAPANVLKKTYKNILFTGEKSTVTCKILVKGILNNQSAIVSVEFDVGISSIVNNAKLKIDGRGVSQVSLSWTIPDSDPVDSVRIWYGKEIVPLQNVIDDSKFKSVTLASSKKDIAITGLDELTTYYFGLQVLKENEWSFVTENSRVTASTTDKPTNLIKLDTLVFSHVTNKFSLKWTNSAAAINTNKARVGIMWATNNYPLKSPPNKFVGIIDSLHVAVSDTTTIDLGENLLFDTLYYFVLRSGVVDADSIIWSEPTSESRGTVRVGSATWQSITYFDKDKSFVYAFNGNVTLKKSPDWGDNVRTDILTVFKPDSDVNMTGFIPVSTGVDFKKDSDSPPIELSLKHTSLPDGFSINDVNMYMYDSLKSWKVIMRQSIDLIAGNVTVRIKPKEYSFPFILMIDTGRPIVTISSDTVSKLEVAADVNVGFSVTDNVSNVISTLQVGDRHNILVNLNSTSKTGDTSFIIPKEYISADIGLRAVLNITDGHFTQKIDISRSIKVAKSNDQSTLAGKWNPISASNHLDKPSIVSSLEELSGESWEYDSLQFRIFRWFDYSGNSSKKEKWVEYRSDINAFFDLTPGKVIWVKTRNSVKYDLGAAYTVSLKEPYSVELPSKQFTDISVPFKFDIKVGDIVDATGEDVLTYYRWEQNSESSIMEPALLYESIAEGVNKPDSTLFNYFTYTVFNDGNSTVTLKIPPIPEEMSAYKSGISKSANSSMWSVALQAETDEGKLSPVFCGYAPGSGVSILPVAPSFAKVHLRVFDTKSNKIGGHIITHELKEDGYAFQLLLVNNSSSKSKMNYRISQNNNLPDDFKAVMFDPVSGAYQSSESVQVKLGAGEKENRWLIVGNQEYIAGWSRTLLTTKFSLVKVFPNPCRGKLSIRFMVPYSGLRELRIAMYDQMGRMIWSKILNNELRVGLNTMQWSPASNKSHIAAGSYILQATAIDLKGNTTGTYQQKLMYLPK